MKYGEIKNLVYLVSDSSESYNQNKDFTTLIAWKKARDVKLFFYNKIIPKLPREEKFNLDTQIRKAAVSITAHIFPRVMVDTIIKKEYSFTESHVLLFMN